MPRRLARRCGAACGKSNSGAIARNSMCMDSTAMLPDDSAGPPPSDGVVICDVGHRFALRLAHLSGQHSDVIASSTDDRSARKFVSGVSGPRPPAPARPASAPRQSARPKIASSSNASRCIGPRRGRTCCFRYAAKLSTECWLPYPILDPGLLLGATDGR